MKPTRWAATHHSNRRVGFNRGTPPGNLGDLRGVFENEDGEAKNWDIHGNLGLHGWAFDRFTSILELKAKVEGIEVAEVDEERTSKTCSVCGRKDHNQRVDRGLYVCEGCDGTFNAEVNGAEYIRLTITDESNSDSSG